MESILQSMRLVVQELPGEDQRFMNEVWGIVGLPLSLDAIYLRFNDGAYFRQLTWDLRATRIAYHLRYLFGDGGWPGGRVI